MAGKGKKQAQDAQNKGIISNYVLNNSFVRFFSFAPLSSSSAHRKTQRACGAAAIVSSTLEDWSGIAMLPGKFAQFLMSFYTFFRSDTHVNEKIIHLLQTVLSGVQIGVAISLFIEGEECDELNKTLCQIAAVLKAAYDATLIIGWLPSEYSKDPEPLIDKPTETEPESAMENGEQEQSDMEDEDGEEVDASSSLKHA